MTHAAALGFWRTVWLLLKTSRRRSDGRRRRQNELLRNRSGSAAMDWGGAAVVLVALLMAALHGFTAFGVIAAVDAGQRIEVERRGYVVVSSDFQYELQAHEAARLQGEEEDRESFDETFRDEAKDIVDRDGGDEGSVERHLRATVAATGSEKLVTRGDVESGLAGLARSGPIGTILGSALLVWWFAMVACQGEGLELDLQRRRHPMWEWLLSHPVKAGGVFFAEMLSPIPANPTFWTAPVFVGILYGASQGFAAGLAGALLVGIPITIAAACLGKALEIGAILRLAVRSRGAAIGMLSWFGMASLVAMVFGATIMSRAAEGLAHLVDPAARFSWPVLGCFLGMRADGSFSFLRGVLFGWAASAAVLAVSVIFSARSIRNGLSGAFASDSLPARRAPKAEFGRDPLFRKEYLWFVRDRSAIVQTILIPLTIASFQLFNLRGVIKHAEDSWNYLSGAAIFFGTYFLWILGPKSLTSEGSALWIALTWPRGLESMLKAKAWLWSMIASGLVITVLVAACFFFPHEYWKIALVAAGWFVFSRSMAEKSVTLVTVVSESGEAQKIPTGRRWAAQLGMLTFAIGIVTQQWNLAVVGIVYSWITAAAMWENLRARLPYLYDPWSETLPPPPTLMHAMIAISILIECASIVTALLVASGGREVLAAGQAIGYALCAVGVSIGMTTFLSDRGVTPAQVWCWRDAPSEAKESESWIRPYLAANRRDVGWLAAGAGGGLLLGLFAHFYLLAISLIPAIGKIVQASQHEMHSIPGMVVAYGVIAIGFAPFAEEYLFRGIVFRALDRQWGGWKAVAGAAAFFAIYHPPLAWLPVSLVGAVNCLLFKNCRRLAPAVLLHMSYNLVVVLWM